MCSSFTEWHDSFANWCVCGVCVLYREREMNNTQHQNNQLNEKVKNMKGVIKSWIIYIFSLIRGHIFLMLTDFKNILSEPTT